MACRHDVVRLKLLLNEPRRLEHGVVVVFKHLLRLCLGHGPITNCS